MNKQELIDRLIEYVSGINKLPRIQIIAENFVYFLQHLNTPQGDKYEYESIAPYLPQLLIEAFDELRTGQDPRVIEFRHRYKIETGYEKILNITDLNKGDNAIRELVVVRTTIKMLLRDIVVSSRDVEKAFDDYCDA